MYYAVADSLKEARLSRGDLTDMEWRVFDPILPDRGELYPMEQTYPTSR
jgi:hypothetical protein